MDRPKEICGIDFSGAVDAGTKIWVAKGFSKGGALIIGQCLRGDALDSVIAAAGTFQALRREDLFAPRDCKAWKLEGYVYA